MPGGVRILEQPRTTVARVHVACDGEWPWAEAGVGTKAPGMLHKPQPGLFKQVFCDIALVRQSGEKVVQAAVECIMHRIERRGIARSQAADELELRLAIHRGNNAEAATT
jgi:hypothetical protein